MRTTAVRVIPPIVLFIAVVAFSAGMLWLLPSGLSLWEVMQVATVDLVLLISVVIAQASASQDGNPDTACFRCSLVLWFFLLVSEELFNRTGGNADSAIAGHFSASAYGEVSLWMIALGVVLLLSLRSPHFVKEIWSRYHKWLSLLVLVCIFSVVYAPSKAFSGAWAFKLFVVALVLTMCARFAQNERDLIAFLRATFLACSFLVAAAIYTAIVDPSAGFDDGRLGQSPTSLSVIAGALLSLSLTLKAHKPSAWMSLAGIVAAVVMILGGGKAGIIGGVLAATLIYALKKRLGSAVGVLGGLVGLGLFLMVVSTGLNSYVHHYADSDLGGNLTGRTGIWDAAVPAIQNRLLLGHGYMASRFVSFEIGSTGEGMWEADHMHNAFLDILYNNGLLGFALILAMHVTIVRLLLRTIRETRSRLDRGTVNSVAIGALAIYINLLINAFFNAIIGGRPSSLYMLFLGVFVLAHTVQRIHNSRRGLPTIEAAYRTHEAESCALPTGA